MCGRFTLSADLKSLLKKFGLSDLDFEVKPRWNIAPSQAVPVIAVPGRLELMRWGLVPSWAKDASIGHKLINARAETLAEKPAFRAAFKSRRCLVPADGFYEWRPAGKLKVPVRVRLKGGDLFAFAGLWETWRSPEDGEVRTFTIVTTEANGLLKPVHDRMPVILKPEDEGRWLDTEEKEPARLTALLKPYPSDRMEFYDVSPAVNSPKNDVPQCAEPAGPPEAPRKPGTAGQPPRQAGPPEAPRKPGTAGRQGELF